MDQAADSPQAAFGASTDSLAARLAQALDGPGGASCLALHVRESDDVKAALAAVRVLGADALAPAVLRGQAVDEVTAALFAEAFQLFPPALDEAFGPLDPDPDTAAVTRWRDWAAGRVAARVGAATLAVPLPARSPAAGLAWPAWSARIAQLAPLALPGLDGPVHRAVRERSLDLARGASRAMLRRDYATAAALGRWIALERGDGPLDPATFLDHLRMFGGAGPRSTLDIRIGLRLLEVRER